MGLRKARPAEAPLLVKIEIDAGQKYRSVGLNDIADPGPAGLPDDLYTVFIDDGDVFVVTDSDDTPIGFAAMGSLAGEPYLVEMSVAIAHQGKGLSRMLMSACETWALDHDHTTLLLSTFRTVPWNGPYYERLGFQFLEDKNCQHPEMLAHRKREQTEGLDPKTRVFMRKHLNR